MIGRQLRKHLQQVGDVCGGLIIGTVDANHCHGGFEQGPLKQDVVLLYLLIGDEQNPNPGRQQWSWCHGSC